jgi:hypothetical protein
MTNNSAGILAADLRELKAEDAARLTPALFVRAVIVPFVFTRMLLVLAGLYAVFWLPGARAFGWNLPTGVPAIDIWSHFDSRWYVSIAKAGYQADPGKMSNVPFAPLFPMLIRAAGIFLGSGERGLYVCAIVVSNMALIVALGYLIALMLRDGHDRSAAGRAAWYVLIFPTSFFFSAGYPMSLYLALALAAFYYARNEQWRIAGVLAGLAALSRPDGVLLTAGLAVEYYLQRGWVVRKELFNLAWGPIGLLAWMGYQWVKLGSPLAFVAAQVAWNSCPIWTVLRSPRAGLQLGPPAVFVVLMILGVRRLRGSYTAFTVIMGAVMLSANRYWSITRFILVLFPAFMMLGLLGRKRWVHLAYTVVSTPLSALLMMRFALNQWVA